MRSILITRPEPQASALATLAREQGINATVFPTMVIEPTENTAWQKPLLNEVTSEDLLVFVSRSAVENSLLPCGGGLEWRVNLPCIAIGKGTAEALTHAGFKNIHYSNDGANSESALALPILQNLVGRTCWVLRGNGGRELLPDTLRQRGALVNILTCYERHLPTKPIEPLIAQWEQTGFDCVICTSIEGLKNLSELLGSDHQSLLQKTPITVLSQTMLRYAQEHGIANTRWVRSAHNADLIQWMLAETTL
jgi:uroporphyrinogen-III synthase